MALLPVLMLFDQMHGEQHESNMTIIHALKAKGSNFIGQNARLDAIERSVNVVQRWASASELPT